MWRLVPGCKRVFSGWFSFMPGVICSIPEAACLFPGVTRLLPGAARWVLGWGGGFVGLRAMVSPRGGVIQPFGPGSAPGSVFGTTRGPGSGPRNCRAARFGPGSGPGIGSAACLGPGSGAGNRCAALFGPGSKRSHAITSGGGPGSGRKNHRAQRLRRVVVGFKRVGASRRCLTAWIRARSVSEWHESSQTVATRSRFVL